MRAARHVDTRRARALNQIAGLAQQVERLPCKQGVGGSIPSTSTRPSQGTFGHRAALLLPSCLLPAFLRAFLLSGPAGIIIDTLRC